VRAPAAAEADRGCSTFAASRVIVCYCAMDMCYSLAAMSRPCAVNAQITATSMTIMRIDPTG
jgi:hypothetical protein